MKETKRKKKIPLYLSCFDDEGKNKYRKKKKSIKTAGLSRKRNKRQNDRNADLRWSCREEDRIYVEYFKLDEMATPVVL